MTRAEFDAIFEKCKKKYLPTNQAEIQKKLSTFGRQGRKGLGPGPGHFLLYRDGAVHQRHALRRPVRSSGCGGLNVRAALYKEGGAALFFLKNSPEKFDGMGKLGYTVSDCVPNEKGKVYYGIQQSCLSAGLSARPAAGVFSHSRPVSGAAESGPAGGQLVLLLGWGASKLVLLMVLSILVNYLAACWPARRTGGWPGLG